jgi:hypothetical protein
MMGKGQLATGMTEEKITGGEKRSWLEEGCRRVMVSQVITMMCMSTDLYSADS